MYFSTRTWPASQPWWLTLPQSTVAQTAERAEEEGSRVCTTKKARYGGFFHKRLSANGAKIFIFFIHRPLQKAGPVRAGGGRQVQTWWTSILKKLILERQNLLYLLKNTVYGYDLFSKDIPSQVRLHAPASLGALRQKSSVAPKTWDVISLFVRIFSLPLFAHK